MSSLQLVKFMGHLNLKESQASINWKTSHIQHLDIPKFVCETWKKTPATHPTSRRKNPCWQVTVWLAFAVAVALKLPLPVASAWWMTGFSWDFPLRYRGFPGERWKCMKMSPSGPAPWRAAWQRLWQQRWLRPGEKSESLLQQIIFKKSCTLH